MNYKKHLYKDTTLARIMGDESFELSTKKNICLQLVRSIISQQLSIKVANVIYNRFLDLFENKNPTAVQILAVNELQLKAIGLSNSKLQYIYNVAKFFVEHKLTDKKIQTLTDEQIIDWLTQIKGIGLWSVQMLLMFCLGRENVFSVDDLGIQQSMIEVYKLNIDDKKTLKQKMITIAQQWEPYRTYACLHLWAYRNNKA